MTDNPFLQDVNAILSKSFRGADTFKKGLATLNERGINSYDSLYSLMRNLDTDTDTLLQAYEVMYHLSDQVDKRRVVSPLMTALKSDNSRLRQQAAWVLGACKSKRAVPLLIEMAQNRDENESVRRLAIMALQATRDKRAMAAVAQYMTDPEEDDIQRAFITRSFAHTFDESMLPTYIAMLEDDLPDIRFWAVYGINYLASHDISSAFSAIDRIAAFDHNAAGLWHVDREAFEALEKFYWKKFFPYAKRNNVYMQIISPAPEYFTYAQDYHQKTETGYITLPTPPVNLKVDPAWFAEQLKSLGAELNVRQPKPQAYLLDWKVKLEGGTLIGGLHRDGYCVVMRGDAKAMQWFAKWYRGVVTTEDKLFLYVWAEAAEEITLSDEVEV